MILLKLILTNLSRHRIRSFISIAFSVAAMFTMVTILQGAGVCSRATFQATNDMKDLSCVRRSPIMSGYYCF